MKITLTEQDIKTLSYNQSELWNYTIKTKHGNLIGSNIDSKEQAIIHAELQATRILSALLSK